MVIMKKYTAKLNWDMEDAIKNQTEIREMISVTLKWKNHWRGLPVDWNRAQSLKRNSKKISSSQRIIKNENTNKASVICGTKSRVLAYISVGFLKIRERMEQKIFKENWLKLGEEESTEISTKLGEPQAGKTQRKPYTLD